MPVSSWGRSILLSWAGAEDKIAWDAPGHYRRRGSPSQQPHASLRQEWLSFENRAQKGVGRTAIALPVRSARSDPIARLSRQFRSFRMIFTAALRAARGRSQQEFPTARTYSAPRRESGLARDRPPHHVTRTSRYRRIRHRAMIGCQIDILGGATLLEHSSVLANSLALK